MKVGGMIVPICALFLVLALFGARPVFALTATTTTVSCSPSSGAVGFITACTAVLGGATPPTDTELISFAQSGGTGSVASATCPLVGGTCTASITTTGTGSPVIQASFSSDAKNQGSSGTFGITVTQSPTSTVASCVPSTVSVGASTLCTATVSGYNPGGSVTFSQLSGTASTSLSTPVVCTLSSGICQIFVSASGVGGANIVATYSGDQNNFASSGPATLTVSPTASTTTVVCNPATLVVGQSTTCTATVSGYSPTGVISWQSSDRSGTFSSNPCTLSSGTCSVSYTPSSSATITASYLGDLNNQGSAGSSSITANVNEMIQITVANSGPATSVTLSGCSVSPTTVPANGTPQSFQATSGCSR